MVYFSCNCALISIHVTGCFQNLFLYSFIHLHHQQQHLVYLDNLLLHQVNCYQVLDTVTFIPHDSRCLKTKVLALECVFKISTKIGCHFSTKIDDHFSHIFILIVFFFKFHRFEWIIADVCNVSYIFTISFLKVLYLVCERNTFVKVQQDIKIINLLCTFFQWSNYLYYMDSQLILKQTKQNKNHSDTLCNFLFFLWIANAHVSIDWSWTLMMLILPLISSLLVHQNIH